VTKDCAIRLAASASSVPGFSMTPPFSVPREKMFAA
jgi:hypothetical protein